MVGQSDDRGRAELRRKRLCSSRRDPEPAELPAAAAREAGFRGTPTFVIGRVQPDGTVRGEAIEGAYPFARFKSAIDGLLHPPAKAGTPDGSPST